MSDIVSFEWQGRRENAELRLIDCECFAAAELLQKQWPMHSVEARSRWISARKDACNFILIPTSSGSDMPPVLAFGRLTASCENQEGKAAVLTSLVTDPICRGLGIGRQMVALLANEARNREYGYLYLWTKDKMNFYKHCGFHECCKVSVSNAALKRVDKEFVGKLEALMGARSRSNDEANEEVIGDSDGWMRLRLRERSVDGMQRIPLQELADAMLPHVSHRHKSSMASNLSDNKYVGLLHPFSWERQIGPMCGISSLYCAAEYFKCNLDKSLLDVAQWNGWTGEGEIFKMEILKHLARYAGLDATIEPFPTPNKLREWLWCDHFVLVPFDHHGGDVGLHNGEKAHFGVISGVILHSSGDARCGLEWYAERAALAGRELGIARDDNVDLEVMIPSGGFLDFHPLCYNDKSMLIIQHSSSRRPIITSYDELKKSNAQLNQNSSVRVDVKFVEGQNMNLRNKVLLITSKLSEKD